MRVTGFVQNSAGTLERPKRPWKLLAFLLIVGVLLYYVVAKWQDFALTLSGWTWGNSAVPASTAQNAGIKEDFFIEFRLDREKTGREQVDMVKAVMNDTTASKEIRDAAYQQYLALVDCMQKELKIEGLLKARGYDGIAFLSPDACTVVVRSASLDEKQVAQIGDAVRRISRLGLDRITVIPANPE